MLQDSGGARKGKRSPSRPNARPLRRWQVAPSQLWLVQVSRDVPCREVVRRVRWCCLLQSVRREGSRDAEGERCVARPVPTPSSSSQACSQQVTLLTHLNFLLLIILILVGNYTF